MLYSYQIEYAENGVSGGFRCKSPMDFDTLLKEINTGTGMVEFVVYQHTDWFPVAIRKNSIIKILSHEPLSHEPKKEVNLVSLMDNIEARR